MKVKIRVAKPKEMHQLKGGARVIWRKDIQRKLRILKQAQEKVQVQT